MHKRELPYLVHTNSTNLLAQTSTYSATCLVLLLGPKRRSINIAVPATCKLSPSSQISSDNKNHLYSPYASRRKLVSKRSNPAAARHVHQKVVGGLSEAWQSLGKVLAENFNFGFSLSDYLLFYCDATYNAM